MFRILIAASFLAAFVFLKTINDQGLHYGEYHVLENTINRQDEHLKFSWAILN
jgi:hypothetical protein